MKPAVKTSAIVLAAGISSRMPGRNKLLLPLGDKTVIEHTVDHLLQSRVEEVVVVLGAGADRIRRALRGREVIVAWNHDYEKGLASSVVAGVGAVSAEAQALLITLGDLPLVRSEEIDHLIGEFEKARPATIAVPTFGGRRGNPVVFDTCYKSEMLAITGDAGCRQILSRFPEQILEVTMPADHILRDVDTEKDYHEIRQVILRGESNPENRRRSN